MLRISAIALLAALGFASVNLSARAEDAPPARHHKEGGNKEGRGDKEGNMRERMHAAMFKGITLSDDQKAALKKLKEAGEEAHKKEAGKDGDKPKKRPSAEERKARMEKHLADIRAILTDDQAKIFDENIKEMKAKRAEMEKKHDECKGECKGKGKGKGERKGDAQ